jgi:hypothetical protein
MTTGRAPDFDYEYAVERRTKSGERYFLDVLPIGTDLANAQQALAEWREDPAEDYDTDGSYRLVRRPIGEWEVLD